MAPSLAARRGGPHRSRGQSGGTQRRGGTDFGCCPGAAPARSLEGVSETNCAPAGRRAWRVLAGLVLPVTALVAVTVWGQFATGTRGGLLTVDLAVAGLSCALLPAL